jgi:hypothetical protein
MQPRVAFEGVSGAGTIPVCDVLGGGGWPEGTRDCIFLLTFGRKNFIYESHCDLFRSQILMSRENRSMKKATKKAAKKKAAPKKKGK